ncbi:MAG: hypothetical protein OJF49_001179 [Ktedonobacterales bacterium]|nr:MAG: hypothetical protein OJF49_001179 [Ktedonobacterales bacterium]
MQTHLRRKRRKISRHHLSSLVVHPHATAQNGRIGNSVLQSLRSHEITHCLQAESFLYSPPRPPRTSKNRQNRQLPSMRAICNCGENGEKSPDNSRQFRSSPSPSRSFRQLCKSAESATLIYGHPGHW